MPRSGRRGWQFRLRDLLVLNVYAAILLSAVLVPDLSNSETRATLLLCVPVLLALVSLIVPRPGPRRDALVMAFFILPFIVMAAVFSIPAAWLVYLTAPPSGMTFASAWQQIAQDPDSVRMTIGASLMAIFFWIFPLIMLRTMGPLPCPACRRRGLIGSLDWSQPETIEKPDNRYRFSWCVACQGRFKRGRRTNPPTWEDASAPEDDKHYGLLSVESLIGKLLSWRRSGPRDSVHQDTHA